MIQSLKRSCLSVRCRYKTRLCRLSLIKSILLFISVTKVLLFFLFTIWALMTIHFTTMHIRIYWIQVLFIIPRQGHMIIDTRYSNILVKIIMREIDKTCDSYRSQGTWLTYVMKVSRLILDHKKICECSEYKIKIRLVVHMVDMGRLYVNLFPLKYKSFFKIPITTIHKET